MQRRPRPPLSVVALAPRRTATVLLEHAVQYTREAQIKEPLGNALVFRLARRDLF